MHIHTMSFTICVLNKGTMQSMIYLHVLVVRSIFTGVGCMSKHHDFFVVVVVRIFIFIILPKFCYTLPGRQFCCICLLLQCQYHIGTGANAEYLRLLHCVFRKLLKSFFFCVVVVDIIVANGDRGG